VIQILVYTLVAIILYVASDRILEFMEIAAGHRFEYRSLVFFFILTSLALISFSLLNRMLASH